MGLERLEAEGGKALRGRRIGLVVHGASVTADGRHAVTVFGTLKLDLRRLFSPEHGLRGTAAAGEVVESTIDPASGLPVVSLYGARKKPLPEDLRDLDALVIDLQDAGVRFYTYASTMMLCLDAAAEAGIEVVILDRPNPLGGDLVTGPLADARAVPTSLLSMTPGPLVHGLTLGEMARLLNARRSKPAALRVVAMTGWRREMRWSDTGRPWTSPSPNLRSADAALAYPGTCLLEATNVSEGRGTESPFLLIGAPWIEPERYLRGLATPGFRLEAATFTPRATASAKEPKYDGVHCAGLRVLPLRPSPRDGYQLGLTLLHALRREPQFQLLRAGMALDTLLGTTTVRKALERGESVDAILKRDDAGPGCVSRASARRPCSTEGGSVPGRHLGLDHLDSTAESRDLAVARLLRERVVLGWGQGAYFAQQLVDLLAEIGQLSRQEALQVVRAQEDESFRDLGRHGGGAAPDEVGHCYAAISCRRHGPA